MKFRSKKIRDNITEINFNYVYYKKKIKKKKDSSIKEYYKIM